MAHNYQQDDGLLSSVKAPDRMEIATAKHTVGSQRQPAMCQTQQLDVASGHSHNGQFEHRQGSPVTHIGRGSIPKDQPSSPVLASQFFSGSYQAPQGPRLLSCKQLGGAANCAGTTMAGQAQHRGERTGNALSSTTSQLGHYRATQEQLALNTGCAQDVEWQLQPQKAEDACVARRKMHLQHDGGYQHPDMLEEPLIEHATRCCTATTASFHCRPLLSIPGRADHHTSSCHSRHNYTQEQLISADAGGVGATVLQQRLSELITCRNQQSPASSMGSQSPQASPLSATTRYVRYRKASLTAEQGNESMDSPVSQSSIEPVFSSESRLSLAISTTTDTDYAVNASVSQAGTSQKSKSAVQHSSDIAASPSVASSSVLSQPEVGCVAHHGHGLSLELGPCTSSISSEFPDSSHGATGKQKTAAAGTHSMEVGASNTDAGALPATCTARACAPTCSYQMARGLKADEHSSQGYVVPSMVNTAKGCSQKGSQSQQHQEQMTCQLDKPLPNARFNCITVRKGEYQHGSTGTSSEASSPSKSQLPRPASFGHMMNDGFRAASNFPLSQSLPDEAAGMTRNQTKQQDLSEQSGRKIYAPRGQTTTTVETADAGELIVTVGHPWAPADPAQYQPPMPARPQEAVVSDNVQSSRDGTATVKLAARGWSSYFKSTPTSASEGDEDSVAGLEVCGVYESLARAVGQGDSIQQPRNGTQVSMADTAGNSNQTVGRTDGAVADGMSQVCGMETKATGSMVKTGMGSSTLGPADCTMPPAISSVDVGAPAVYLANPTGNASHMPPPSAKTEFQEQKSISHKGTQARVVAVLQGPVIVAGSDNQKSKKQETQCFGHAASYASPLVLPIEVSQEGRERGIPSQLQSADLQVLATQQKQLHKAVPAAQGQKHVSQHGACRQTGQQSTTGSYIFGTAAKGTTLSRSNAPISQPSSLPFMPSSITASQDAALLQDQPTMQPAVQAFPLTARLPPSFPHNGEHQSLHGRLDSYRYMGGDHAGPSPLPSYGFSDPPPPSLPIQAAAVHPTAMPGPLGPGYPPEYTPVPMSTQSFQYMQSAQPSWSPVGPGTAAPAVANVYGTAAPAQQSFPFLQAANPLTAATAQCQPVAQQPATNFPAANYSQLPTHQPVASAHCPSQGWWNTADIAPSLAHATTSSWSYPGSAAAFTDPPSPQNTTVAGNQMPSPLVHGPGRDTFTWDHSTGASWHAPGTAGTGISACSSTLSYPPTPGMHHHVDCHPADASASAGSGIRPGIGYDCGGNMDPPVGVLGPSDLAVPCDGWVGQLFGRESLAEWAGSSAEAAAARRGTCTRSTIGGESCRGGAAGSGSLTTRGFCSMHDSPLLAARQRAGRPSSIIIPPCPSSQEQGTWRLGGNTPISSSRIHSLSQDAGITVPYIMTDDVAATVARFGSNGSLPASSASSVAGQTQARHVENPRASLSRLLSGVSVVLPQHVAQQLHKAVAQLEQWCSQERFTKYREGLLQHQEELYQLARPRFDEVVQRCIQVQLRGLQLLLSSPFYITSWAILIPWRLAAFSFRTVRLGLHFTHLVLASPQHLMASIPAAMESGIDLGMRVLVLGLTVPVIVVVRWTQASYASALHLTRHAAHKSLSLMQLMLGSPMAVVQGAANLTFAGVQVVAYGQLILVVGSVQMAWKAQGAAWHWSVHTSGRCWGLLLLWYLDVWQQVLQTVADSELGLGTGHLRAGQEAVLSSSPVPASFPLLSPSSDMYAQWVLLVAERLTCKLLSQLASGLACIHQLLRAHDADALDAAVGGWHKLCNYCRMYCLRAAGRAPASMQDAQQYSVRTPDQVVEEQTRQQFSFVRWEPSQVGLAGWHTPTLQAEPGQGTSFLSIPRQMRAQAVEMAWGLLDTFNQGLVDTGVYLLTCFLQLLLMLLVVSALAFSFVVQLGMRNLGLLPSQLPPASPMQPIQALGRAGPTAAAYTSPDSNHAALLMQRLVALERPQLQHDSTAAVGLLGRAVTRMVLGAAPAIPASRLSRHLLSASLSNFAAWLAEPTELRGASTQLQTGV